ncbi:LytTR family DNA-binding domain-containing protein [Agriterribacter sp.]|uniref:LytR/AlgR family response regulator transcription factor n=1 Tax=Agriterribacter sp. TaxID=2821509 RepID=UPI002BBF9CD4|nr:LytTR family DNA-binding domain-containing protein [Agriterribacter sp.]HRO46692.1 LytTR family DNA-binding domain-containing protein [Agriterribacter sp.]HRQ16968.1 LytTR family DNA-binding domain-containing protein [Agriterribacter sp.]
MIKCVLVDDETNALEMMEWLLKTYCPQAHIVAMCNTAEKGIEAISRHKPDVVFLDIEMPRMNGFDMLEQVKNVTFEIVFCTAYDQFAIKAFKYAALNYLLKPVDPDDLKATMQRVEEKRAVPSKEQFALLLQHINRPPKSTPSRIALTTGEGLIFVPTAEIIYCKAESNYTNVVLTGGRKIMVSRVLKELDETLSGPDFYRVHSSFLIGINHVKKFVRGEGGYIVMDNDDNITLSRSRRQEFMELFSRF